LANKNMATDHSNPIGGMRGDRPHQIPQPMVDPGVYPKRRQFEDLHGGKPVSESGFFDPFPSS